MSENPEVDETCSVKQTKMDQKDFAGFLGHTPSGLSLCTSDHTKILGSFKHPLDKSNDSLLGC